MAGGHRFQPDIIIRLRHLGQLIVPDSVPAAYVEHAVDMPRSVEETVTGNEQVKATGRLAQENRGVGILTVNDKMRIGAHAGREIDDIPVVGIAFDASLEHPCGRLNASRFFFAPETDTEYISFPDVKLIDKLATIRIIPSNISEKETLRIFITMMQ